MPDIPLIQISDYNGWTWIFFKGLSECLWTISQCFAKVSYCPATKAILILTG